MFKYENTMYAGITTMEGLELFSSNPFVQNHTGYIFKDIRNGSSLGNTITISDEIDERFLVEVEEEYTPECLIANNTMYAGLENESAIEIFNLSNHGFTGKTFVRIHDGAELGNVVTLGQDWSYYGDKPREDKAKFYTEVPVIITEEGE